MTCLYLDYAATYPMLQEVKDAMRAAEDRLFGNASSLHTPGHQAYNGIEKTRELLAGLINAEPDEIIFTSGASEGNNTVIRTFEGCEIETSPYEHHSVLAPAALCKGSKIPKLYSYMLANNETGDFLALPSLDRQSPQALALSSSECQSLDDSPLFAPTDDWGHPLVTDRRSSYLHSDLTQALGKIPLDVKKLGLDYATFSAHKIGGPLGVGALYVRKGVPFRPFILGGNQENKRRGGTYNTIGIIGFGKALEVAQRDKAWVKYDQEVRALRDRLHFRILTEIPGASINTDIDNSLPNILNVSFAAAEGESIQLYLDAKGIVVSTGSACAAGDTRPSHVLMAKTGGNAEIAHSSVRFSFGLENVPSDVDKLMIFLPRIIRQLQNISTIRS